MNSKIENVFNKIIVVLLSGFVLLSLIYTLMYNPESEYSTKNILPVIFSALIIFLAVFSGFKIIDKINDKQLNCFVFFCFFGFALCELFFICNFSSIPTTDSYRCFDTAIGFVNGENPFIDETDVYYRYFCHYSNNNMFISILYVYFSVLKVFGITSFLLFARLLNAFLIFVSVVFMYLSVKLLFKKRFAAKALLIFTVNPSLYFHIEWVYTLTFSLPFMTAILYFCLLAKREKSTAKRIIFCVITAILSAIGYLLRPTSIFPLIAFAVIGIVRLRLKKAYLVKLSVCAVSFLLVFLVVFVPLSSKVNERFESTLKYNFPITHWVMMGLGDTGKLDYNDPVLTENFGETKSAKVKGNLAEIKRRIADKGVIGTAKHFAKKTVYTFTDGSHEIRLRINRQQSYSSAYKYLNGENNYLFLLYCQGFRAFTYLFMLIALVCLIFSKQNVSRFMPFIITAFGGFVFYLFWESKQSYSLPFTLFFLSLAAYGLDKTNEKIKFSYKLKGKFPVSDVFSLCMAVSLIFTGGFGFNYLKSHETHKEKYDYSINYFDKKFAKAISAKSFSQEFYTDKSFDFVKLYVYKGESLNVFKNNNYTIDLKIKNSENIIVASKTVSVQSFKSKDEKFAYFKIKFPRVLNENRQKFTLFINCGENANPLNWVVSKSVGIDIYKGDLKIYDNLKIYDKRINSDAFMVVGNTL